MVIRRRGVPDIVHTVLPIAFSSPALFSLPGDPASKAESFRQLIGDYHSRAPVATDVHRAVWLQERYYGIHPLDCKLTVILIGASSEAISVIVFGQIIRRIDDDKISKADRESAADTEGVAAEHFIIYIISRNYVLLARTQRRIFLSLVAVNREVYRFIARGLFTSPFKLFGWHILRLSLMVLSLD